MRVKWTLEMGVPDAAFNARGTVTLGQAAECGVLTENILP
jgi:hypothetical protein